MHDVNENIRRITELQKEGGPLRQTLQEINPNHPLITVLDEGCLNPEHDEYVIDAFFDRFWYGQPETKKPWREGVPGSSITAVCWANYAAEMRQEIARLSVAA